MFVPPNAVCTRRSRAALLTATAIALLLPLCAPEPALAQSHRPTRPIRLERRTARQPAVAQTYQLLTLASFDGTNGSGTNFIMIGPDGKLYS
jgi:hypothetical protein